jgi:hypothetical protein
LEVHVRPLFLYEHYNSILALRLRFWLPHTENSWKSDWLQTSSLCLSPKGREYA